MALQRHKIVVAANLKLAWTMKSTIAAGESLSKVLPRCGPAIAPKPAIKVVADMMTVAETGAAAALARTAVGYVASSVDSETVHVEAVALVVRTVENYVGCSRGWVADRATVAVAIQAALGTHKVVAGVMQAGVMQVAGDS